MAVAATPKTDSSKYPMPFTRIEVVLMTLVEGNLAVLLARRAQAPYAGKWALPGGVLRIDLDGSLEEAAARVVRERLATDLPDLKQLCAVGGPARDPRAPWGLSIVYRALSPSGSALPTAGKRIEELRWMPVQSLAKGASLAFDHDTLVARATDAMREDVDELDLPYGLLPARFTLTELQQTCEAVLSHALDKSSFRRRLNDREVLEPIEGEKRGGAFRPAQLYQQRARSGSPR